MPKTSSAMVTAILGGVARIYSTRRVCDHYIQRGPPRRPDPRWCVHAGKGDVVVTVPASA